MEFAQFDRFTKLLASGNSRRTILKGLLGGAAVASVSTTAHAQDATPGALSDSDQTQWLIVVDFSGADVVASEDDPAKLSITLNGVDFDSVAFSDHPDRIVQIVDPEQVAQAINDSADDPLNAALVGRVPVSRERSQVIVALHSASYDVESETLVIEAEAIASDDLATPVALEPFTETSLRAGSLFIDDVVIEIIVEPREGSAESCAGQYCNPIFPDCCKGTYCAPWGGHLAGSCLRR